MEGFSYLKATEPLGGDSSLFPKKHMLYHFVLFFRGETNEKSQISLFSTFLPIISFLNHFS